MLGRPHHSIKPDHIARRRAFELEMQAFGYRSLAEVGYDGPWVSPIQMMSGHPTGPVLLAKDYLDAASLVKLRAQISPTGYLPGNPFNKVVDLALEKAGLARTDIYITQCFAAIQNVGRSTSLPIAHFRASFESVGKHELAGRRILALGPLSIKLCNEFSLPHIAIANHPSARGPGMTIVAKAEALARGLRTAMGGAASRF